MKRLHASLVLVACAVACRVYPAPDATHVFQCSAATDCASGACGGDGFCVDGPIDAGASDGGDAGFDAGCACATGEGCYRGACLPSCADAGTPCAGSAVCDLATDLCVAVTSCNLDSDCRASNQKCLGGVCVTPPGASSQDPGCEQPDAGGDVGEGDGGDAGILVTGNVQLFASEAAAVGAQVYFFSFFDIVTAEMDAGTYATSLAAGPWSAEVVGPGLVSTYFPGLQIGPVAGEAQTSLDLNAVVSQTTLQSIANTTGFVTTPGRWTWVGAVEDCTSGSWLGGYTAAVSPPPGLFGYCAADAGIGCLAVGNSLATSDAAVGTFIALDVPETDASGVIAVNEALVSKALVHESLAEGVNATFNSAVADGGFAVALIYPNWNQ